MQGLSLEVSRRIIKYITDFPTIQTTCLIIISYYIFNYLIILNKNELCVLSIDGWLNFRDWITLHLYRSNTELNSEKKHYQLISLGAMSQGYSPYLFILLKYTKTNCKINWKKQVVLSKKKILITKIMNTIFSRFSLHFQYKTQPRI